MTKTVLWLLVLHTWLYGGLCYDVVNGLKLLILHMWPDLQKGSAIINNEKSRFEILTTVYLKNAWCLVYELLHQSIVIQGNSASALFDGLHLLAEFPTILDGFSPVPLVIHYIYRGGWLGVVWSHEVAGKTHAVQLHLFYGSTYA